MARGIIVNYNPPNTFCGLSLDKTDHVTQYWTMVIISAVGFDIGELTQRRRQRQRKRHLKINIREMVTIFRLLLLPRILYNIVDRSRCKWTGRSAVEVNIENERLTVACSRCR